MDIGQNVWSAREKRSWMVPAGLGTLGLALPMAIGAAIARPDRPAICVSGDGGALFTIGEMASAADLELPLLMLLWNNQGYEEMRDEFDLAGIPHVGTEAQAHGYLTIARGFGWDAARPNDSDDLAEKIAHAVARSRPTLLELTPALLS